MKEGKGFNSDINLKVKEAVKGSDVKSKSESHEISS